MHKTTLTSLRHEMADVRSINHENRAAGRAGKCRQKVVLCSCFVLNVRKIFASGVIKLAISNAALAPSEPLGYPSEVTISIRSWCIVHHMGKSFAAHHGAKGSTVGAEHSS